MRVEINTKLVTRNRRIAQYLFFFSFGVLIVAFIVTNQQALDPNASQSVLTALLPSLMLPIGLIATLVSVRMTNLWIREPRPERVMKDGLKGLSNKSVLYHYYHLPARHVLVCPQGVFAITVRYQEGLFTVKGDQWSTQGGALSALLRIFRRDGIGSPNLDAQRAVSHVEKLLASIAPEVEVKPLIVFTDPRARVTIENPTVPILYANPDLEPSLKGFMRDYPKEGRSTLTPAQIQAFEQATVAS